MEYDERVSMKVRGGRGRSALYYMPTNSTSVTAVDASYTRLKLRKMYLTLDEGERWCFLLI